MVLYKEVGAELHHSDPLADFEPSSNLENGFECERFISASLGDRANNLRNESTGSSAKVSQARPSHAEQKLSHAKPS